MEPAGSGEPGRGALGVRTTQRVCSGRARSAGATSRSVPSKQRRIFSRYIPRRSLSVSTGTSWTSLTWDLTGYGFERFARGPNSVVSLAAYWIEHVRESIRFENDHPGLCHRVYYEDLVTGPETVAERIFEFLGASTTATGRDL